MYTIDRECLQLFQRSKSNSKNELPFHRTTRMSSRTKAQRRVVNDINASRGGVDPEVSSFCSGYYLLFVMLHSLRFFLRCLAMIFVVSQLFFN